MASSATLQPLLRLLNPTAKVQWRRDAASVWSLCDDDPLRLAEWCLRRLEMGLCEVPSEEKFLRQVMGSCHAVVDVEVRPVFKAMKRSATAEHTAFLEAEKERVKAWDERRKAMAEREEKRRQATSHEAIRQRVAAAPKPAVLTLHRQRLERSLKATPDMTEPITTPPATTTHSRKPKGECGVRLGKKLDKLIAEIQHEAACESSCCASPVAVIERPPEKTDVVDPPKGDDCGGAVVAEGQPVEPAGTGGSAGFTHSATAWDCMAGKAELISEVQDFLKELDELPDLRAAATLRSLSRIRGELERIPETAALGDPVELRLQDVLVIARQMLARLR